MAVTESRHEAPMARLSPESPRPPTHSCTSHKAKKTKENCHLGHSGAHQSHLNDLARLDQKQLFSSIAAPSPLSRTTRKTPILILTLHRTVDIRPQPGVSITEQLEPAVRNVQSPCGNFSWGCRSTEATEGLLRISLLHNDTSCRNVGNLARINRLLGKSPATWDCGPPMSIEQIKEKLAMDMRDMIADVHMVVVRQTELVAWSHIDCGRAQA